MLITLTKPNNQALFVLDDMVITESPDREGVTEIWVGGSQHLVTERPSEIIRLIRQAQK